MPIQFEGDQLEALTARHRETGVLVDTNLLVVYLVALFSDKWAAKFGFSTEAVELVKLVVGPFKKVIVTSAILAEVTNLANVRLPEDIYNALLDLLSALLPKEPFSERAVSLEKAISGKGFARLGFADGTIEELARSGVPVLTTDFDLYFLLASNNLEVFNFNHIRYIADDDFE